MSNKMGLIISAVAKCKASFPFKVLFFSFFLFLFFLQSTEGEACPGSSYIVKVALLVCLTIYHPSSHLQLVRDSVRSALHIHSPLGSPAGGPLRSPCRRSSHAEPLPWCMVQCHMWPSARDCHASPDILMQEVGASLDEWHSIIQERNS